MLVKRIEYQCNYASECLSFDDSKSSLSDTLLDAMKYYSIIKEPKVVYSSQTIAIQDLPTEIQQ